MTQFLNCLDITKNPLLKITALFAVGWCVGILIGWITKVMTQ